MTSHPNVIFVGDKPSKKNLDVSLPFVGTTSYKRLLEWIHALNIDFRKCDMVNVSDDFLKNDITVEEMNKTIDSGTLVVVALGKSASNYLGLRGIKKYLELPHPSGLNRQNNDKKSIAKLLKSHKKYIHFEVKNQT